MTAYADDAFTGMKGLIIARRRGVDPRRGALYIERMTGAESIDPTERDLKRLEARVDELIRACIILKEENRSLRSRQENLVAERAALIKKTELARNRVEAIISRLKGMESGT